MLPGPARTLAVAARHADPAGADPAPSRRAVLGLQLRLLGPADGRPAVGGLGAPPRQARGRRASRDRRPSRRDETTCAPFWPPAPRPRGGGGLGEGAPGGRRLVGRDP